MTLKEYLDDYASEETKKNGEKIIIQEMDNLINKDIKDIVAERLREIDLGKRDFRF